MEKKERNKIAAFDALFANNQTQVLKIILSYMPASFQKNLVVYIKLLELQYALSFFQRHPFAACGEASSEEKQDTAHFFDEILPFCDISQREKILQLKNMMQNIKNMQEMMETFEMMKELFPEGMGSGAGPNMGTNLAEMMSSLSGMGGMADLFGMFQNAPGDKTAGTPPPA